MEEVVKGLPIAKHGQARITLIGILLNQQSAQALDYTVVAALQLSLGTRTHSTLTTTIYTPNTLSFHPLQGAQYRTVRNQKTLKDVIAGVGWGDEVLRQTILKY